MLGPNNYKVSFRPTKTTIKINKLGLKWKIRLTRPTKTKTERKKLGLK